MKYLVSILSLCLMCAMAKGQEITYDTSIIWDEEAIGYAFYFAECETRQHDEVAWAKFLNNLSNKERTINDFLKLYRDVFSDIPSSTLAQEEKEFVRTLVKIQNKVTGSSLSVDTVGGDLIDLLNKAAETCKQKTQDDVVGTIISWEMTAASYDVFVKEGAQTKLISQSDYEKGKYKGDIAGVKYTAEYDEVWDHPNGPSYYGNTLKCVMECMIGNVNCFLREFNKYGPPVDKQQEKEKEKQKKEWEKREKEREKQEKKREEQERKKEDEALKIKYNNPETVVQYLDNAGKMCKLALRDKLLPSQELPLIELEGATNFVVFISNNGQRSQIDADTYYRGDSQGSVIGIRFKGIYAKRVDEDNVLYYCEVVCENKECTITDAGQML